MSNRHNIGISIAVYYATAARMISSSQYFRVRSDAITTAEAAADTENYNDPRVVISTPGGY